jgi:hypothetical protein
MSSGSTSSDESQFKANEKTIVDHVNDQLTSLRADRRLSKDDKNLLDLYISSVHDLQKSVQGNTSSCSKPALTFEQKEMGNIYYFPWNTFGIVDTAKMFENYVQAIKIAFMCDLTRLVFIENTIYKDHATDVDGDPASGLHHELTHADVQATRQGWGIKKLGDLAMALKNTNDPSGTGNILDNSILLYTNELGAWTTSHNIMNIPSLTFGKGGGALRTGCLFDFRQRPLQQWLGTKYNPGRPYKQLLQTVMAAMGVPKTEYIQFGDGQGFGEFNPDINQFGHSATGVYSAYQNEHNNPLPYVYVG